MTDRLVCHFLLDPRAGGPHVYASTLAAQMSGVRSLFVTGGKGASDLSLINLRHFWAPLYALEVPLNVMLIVLWRIMGKLSARNTVFAVHGAANIAPVIAARLLSVPVAWHVHETVPGLKGIFAIGHALKPARTIVAVVAHKSIEAFGVEDAVYFPAAVDTAFWDRHLSPADASVWKEDHARLVMVGNMNPLKGADVLISALEAIESRVHLRILGAELRTHQRFADELRQMAASSNHTVEFAGFADRESVRTHLATCDVFVLPSRSEACPTVVLEAMAMGCTCAVADVGDVGLMIDGYEGAFLFAPDNRESCARSVRLALDYRGGHGDVADTWRIESLASRAEALYSKLLQ